MCGWCLAYCTGVVLNTVRESATPDSKENKQADAGSRLFFEGIFCAARYFVIGIVHRQSVKVYLHMYTGNVQQNFYAQHPVIKNLHISPPVLAYDFLSRCKFSTPTSTPLYSSTNRLY